MNIYLLKREQRKKYKRSVRESKDNDVNLFNSLQKVVD